MARNRRPFVTGVALACIAVLLGSCGKTANDRSAPKQPGGNAVASISELKSAFESAGGDCSSWLQDDRIQAAIASGSCSTATVLSIYPSHKDALKAATNLVSLGVGPSSLIIGDDWIVNTDKNVDSVSKNLGGELYTSIAAHSPAALTGSSTASASQSTETGTSATTGTDFPVGPKRFIATMRKLVPHANAASDDQLLTLGRVECQALHVMGSFKAVAFDFFTKANSDGLGLNAYDIDVSLLNAIYNFCPEYTSLIPKSQ